MIQISLFLGFPILLKDKLDIFAPSYTRINNDGDSNAVTPYSSRLRTFLWAYKWSCRFLTLATLATIFLGIYQYGLIESVEATEMSGDLASKSRPSAAVSSFEWNEHSRSMSLIGLFALLCLLKIYLIISDIVRGCYHSELSTFLKVTSFRIRHTFGRWTRIWKFWEWVRDLLWKKAEEVN